MKRTSLTAVVSAGLLLTVTACADSHPDRVLTEDELTTILPDEDAPGGLEVTSDIQVRDRDRDYQAWRGSVEGTIEVAENAQEHVLADSDATEYAEECVATIDDSIEVYQQQLDEVPEDADFGLTTASLSYQHADGADINVLVFSEDPEVESFTDPWLDEPLACYGQAGQFPHTAQEVEETSLGDATGYQSRMAEETEHDWGTVLYDRADYLLVVVQIGTDEPVDGDLAEDIETLLDDIRERAAEVDQ